MTPFTDVHGDTVVTDRVGNYYLIRCSKDEFDRDADALPCLLDRNMARALAADLLKFADEQEGVT